MKTLERIIWPLVFGAAFAAGISYEKATGGFRVCEMSLARCDAKQEQFDRWIALAHPVCGGQGPIARTK